MNFGPPSSVEIDLITLGHMAGQGQDALVQAEADGREAERVAKTARTTAANVGKSKASASRQTTAQDEEVFHEAREGNKKTYDEKLPQSKEGHLEWVLSSVPVRKGRHPTASELHHAVSPLGV